MPASVYYLPFWFLWLQDTVFDASVTSLSPHRQRRLGKSQAMPPQSDLTTASLPPTTASKTNIIAIRHGTSVSNEWMTGENAWFSPTFCDDIRLVDSPLSEKGIAQAQHELPEKLQCVLESTILNELVVLVSPLMRCLQTWYYGVQPLLPPTKVPTIIVPLLRERVYSTSDTGQPWGVLKTKCSESFFDNNTELISSLDWSLMQDSHAEQESWWYSVKDGHVPPEEWRPCSEQQYYAVPGEPEEVFRERLQQLEEWLRREYVGKTVVLVTHWGVLHHFTQSEVSNCGICHWSLEWLIADLPWSRSWFVVPVQRKTLWRDIKAGVRTLCIIYSSSWMSNAEICKISIVRDAMDGRGSFFFFIYII